MKLLNNKEADVLEKWLIRKMVFKLRKELIYIKIPNELVQELINPKVLKPGEKLLRHYLTYYLQKSNDIINKNLTNFQEKHVERIKELAKLTKEKRIRFGIYQASNYLYDNREPEVYSKTTRPRKYQTGKKIMDDPGFALLCSAGREENPNYYLYRTGKFHDEDCKKEMLQHVLKKSL